MNIAESSGFAAALAIKQNKTPAQINPDALLRKLAEARVMISFFNDVDVSSKEEWVPAVQYLGTKGFFSSYDARPNEPLTEALAKRWAAGFASIRKGDSHDAMTLARAVASHDSSTEPAIHAEQFVRILSEAHPNDAGAEVSKQLDLEKLKIARNAPLSRGNACRMMWHLLFDN